MKKLLKCLPLLALCLVLCGCVHIQATFADAMEDFYGIDEKTYEEHLAYYQKDWDELSEAYEKLFNMAAEEAKEYAEEAIEDALQELATEETTSEQDTKKAAYDEAVQEFLNNTKYQHKAKWPGSAEPEKSSQICWGCCAYAADFVKIVFDHSSTHDGERFSDPNNIRPGDVIHVNEGYYYDAEGKLKEQKSHWLVVLDRDGDNLTVAEGNWTVGDQEGVVRVSDDVYTVENNTFCSKGKPFRKIVDMYHHMDE